MSAAQTEQQLRTILTAGDRLDDITRARMWSRIEDGIAAPAPAPAKAGWRRPAALALGAIAAAAAVLLVVRSLHAPAAPESQLSVAADSTLSTRIGPHARAALVGPARLELLGPAGDATSVRLDRGTLLAEFTGGPGRSLRIEAADLVIEIVGTLFAVEVTEGRACVAVAHGRVRVTRGATVSMVTDRQQLCSGDDDVHGLPDEVGDQLSRHERSLLLAASPTPDPTRATTETATPTPSPTPTANAASPSLTATATSPGTTTTTPTIQSRETAVAPDTGRTPANVAGATASTSSRPISPRPTTATGNAAPPPPSSSTATDTIATAPNATEPNATAPNATAPIATAPNATRATTATAITPGLPPSSSSRSPTGAPRPTTAAAPTATTTTATDPTTIAATASPAAEPPTAPSAEDLYRRAERALAAGDRAGADRALAQLVALGGPLVDQALYERARIAYQGRAWKAARAQLAALAAIAGTPLAEPGRYLDCRIAVESKASDAERCFTAYRATYPQSPHDLDVLAVLAQLAHARGGCSAARPLRDELIARYPRTDHAAAWRSRCPEAP